MELVALRNMRVANHNTMIEADHKKDNILDVTTFKGINFEEVAKTLFAQRNAGAVNTDPAIGADKGTAKKNEVELGFKLGTDEKIVNLYTAQEEFISL